MIFEGANSISVDTKGRIAIPTRYRSDLIELDGGYLHITSHFDETCLLVFSESDWLKFRERVAAWPTAVAWRKRLVLNYAEGVEMDTSNGRVLLSRSLREIAHLGKDAMFVGNGSHFELWNKDAYMAKLEKERQASLPEFLEGFSF